MAANDTILIDEILSITGAAPSQRRFAIPHLIINAGSDTFYIDRVVTVAIDSDFKSNMTDRINVTFQIQQGDFIKRLLPNRDNLTATLKLNLLGGPVKAKFRMGLAVDPRIDTKALSNVNEYELNQRQAEVTCELVEDHMIYMSGKDATSSVYKKVTVTDVILNELSFGTGPLAEMAALTGMGVKMVLADNTRVYDHIMIPTGKKSLGVPKYLQESDYGVYNGGINVYKRVFDTTSLYIYPPYRPNLFSFMEKTLKVIVSSDNSMKNVTSSYVVDGSTIKIAVFTGSKHAGDERDIINRGNRIASTGAGSINTRSHQIAPDKMKIDSSAQSDFTQHRILKSGYAKSIDGGVTDNQYRLRSRVLAADKYYVQVEWHNSNSLLLKPMMAVTYIEERNNRIEYSEGLLHGISTVIDGNTQTEHTILTLLLKHTGDIGGSFTGVLSKVF